jgi:hypothetical protein
LTGAGAVMPRVREPGFTELMLDPSRNWPPSVILSEAQRNEGSL